MGLIVLRFTQRLSFMYVSSAPYNCISVFALCTLRAEMLSQDFALLTIPALDLEPLGIRYLVEGVLAWVEAGGSAGMHWMGFATFCQPGSCRVNLTERVHNHSVLNANLRVSSPLSCSCHTQSLKLTSF